MRRRRCGTLFLFALAGAGAAFIAPAAVQLPQYPTRPVRVIVPFPAASGLDVVARLLAQPLSEKLGQNSVIDNRAGAGGTLGADLAAKAPADGHTLLMISTSHAFSVSLYRQLPYDLVRDFAPITLIAQTPNVMVVTAGVPATTVKELIALAQAKPRTLNFASSGAGTSSHVAAELFRSMAHVDLVHVPYKGAGAALVAILSGEVQVGFFSIPSTQPHLKSGKLRLLGVGSTQRSALLPELPTIAESGVPGYDATTWYGALTPARTPRAIVERLNRDIVQCMRGGDMRERLAAQGAEPRTGTPGEFGAYLKAEIVKYARLVKEMGVQPE